MLLFLAFLVSLATCSVESGSRTLLLECNHAVGRIISRHRYKPRNQRILTRLPFFIFSSKTQRDPTVPESLVTREITKSSAGKSQRKEVFAANCTFQDVEYQRRKQEWINRYTTLNGLRDTFGGNHNKLWGDLDPVTTRKLYKSLLPTALCELVLELGVPPEELARLAYEARKAAKLYARERSRVPSRIAASAYDGFRQLKRYGKFQPSGMSYDQIWDKYRRIAYLESAERSSGLAQSSSRRNKNDSSNGSETNNSDSDDLVARTCMKIIESSCRTDQFALRGFDSHHGKTKSNTMGRAEMKQIVQTLEDDVRRLLAPYASTSDKNQRRRK